MDEEFQHIKAAIESAADTLASALDKHATGQWDYLVVAVPSGRRVTHVPMMTSVLPEELAAFTKYLAFITVSAQGSMLTNQPGVGKPS